MVLDLKDAATGMVRLDVSLKINSIFAIILTNPKE
jgi:hypothetical protein